MIGESVFVGAHSNYCPVSWSGEYSFKIIVAHHLYDDLGSDGDLIHISDEHTVWTHVQDDALERVRRWPTCRNEAGSAGFCSCRDTVASNERALIFCKKHFVLHKTAASQHPLVYPANTAQPAPNNTITLTCAVGSGIDYTIWLNYSRFSYAIGPYFAML